MRTKKELLQLMLDNIRLMDEYGLCAVIVELQNRNMISFDESLIIRAYLSLNRPRNFRNLFKPVFYWVPGRKRPRIKWLKKHIKLNGV